MAKYMPQTESNLDSFNSVKAMDFKEALSEIKWGLRMWIKQLSDEGPYT